METAMAEIENVPVEAAVTLEQAGSAEVAIGLPSCDNAASLSATVERIRSAVAGIEGAPLTVILYSDAIEAVERETTANLRLAPFAFPPAPLSRFEMVRPVLEAAQRLSAKACCVWNLAPDDLTSSAMTNLLRPVAAESFDLAVARYSGRRYDGLINSSIVSPLTQALYGQRIRYPMATDLACSASLAERLLRPDAKTGRPMARDWIPAFAVREGFRICQAEINAPLPSSAFADASTALVEIVGPLLADIEHSAHFWQRFRGSKAVPYFGTPTLPTDTPQPIDVAKMIESFHAGWSNLKEVWGPILPPATLLQVKRLVTLPANQFRMPDELWSRCVYDFVLGYRLRLMSTDHLLRAMTPLYLAWVASYALEVQNYFAAQVEHRLEQVGAAFETQKPYFLSRWRWPDRFHP